MKQVLYACRDSKNSVRGLNFLLSNENIELRGCLIPDRCENVREICKKMILTSMMTKRGIK